MIEGDLDGTGAELVEAVAALGVGPGHQRRREAVDGAQLDLDVGDRPAVAVDDPTGEVILRRLELDRDVEGHVAELDVDDPGDHAGSADDQPLRPAAIAGVEDPALVGAEDESVAQIDLRADDRRAVGGTDHTGEGHALAQL